MKSIKTNAETRSQVNTNGPKPSVQLKYIDGDKKSFNYEHIISFIRKGQYKRSICNNGFYNDCIDDLIAWDSAKCDHRYVSYESSPKVN